MSLMTYLEGFIVKKKPMSASELRDAAERQLAATLRQFPRGDTLKVDDLKLIQELQLHQIELQMQGEILAETVTELEALSAKYQDLYEFAPVSFFTLSGAGEIIEANHHAAAALHVKSGALVGRRLRDFIHTTCVQEWDMFLKNALETSGEVTVESLMVRATLPKYVNAQAHAYTDKLSGNRQISVAFMDVTLLKMAQEDALRALKTVSGISDL